MIAIRSLYLILLLCIGLISQAQFPAIDLIRERFHHAATEKDQLSAIIELGSFRNSLNADTAKRYFTLGRDIAVRLNDTRRLRWVEYYLLAGELTKGNTDSVIPKLEANPIFRFSKNDDQELYYKLQLLKANVLNRTNERVKAIEMQLSLLAEAEKDKNLLAQCYLRNYIGASYLNSGRIYEARTMWLEALALVAGSSDLKIKEIETTITSNLALFYFQQIDSTLNVQKTDSFLLFNNAVIANSRQYHFYWLLPTALSYRGDYFGLIGDLKAGEADFKEALAIRQKIGDPLYTVNDMFRLAGFYKSQKQYDSAINVLLQTIQLIKRAHLKEAIIRVYGPLSYLYKQKGDYKLYSAALEQFILDADTAIRLNDNDKISELMTRYDLQKKETLIANQKAELANRNLYIIASLLVLALTLTIFYFYFKEYKRKQFARNQAAVEEAENKERKRIAAELHDNMGVHANAILHNSSLLEQASSENGPLIQNLQETAREMLGSLRETVWALKATEVTATETWLRLVTFMQQNKRNFSGIGFQITGAAPETQLLTSVKALHLIMIVKEAVTNAIKHAKAGTITVNSSFDKDWIITVADDGKGFDLHSEQLNIEGNGIQNMKDRAAAGGFEVIIKSIQGVGTTITLKI